jgi:signal peptide peptidase SppA
MPMPEPEKGETRDDFHSRCMGNPTMRKDYPDQAQRNAVCYRQWDDAHPENPHPKQVEPEEGTTLACWSNHLGLWCIEPLWFTQAVAAFKAGMWPMRAINEAEIVAAEREKRPYQMKEDVAVIPLHGPMSKGGSMKFEGTSTVRTQRAIRMAARDESVRAILLEVDSPGGHVAGTAQLADEVFRTRQMKPIGAHIADLGASAALWVASQASFISGDPTSEVGSIGTVLALEDSSKRMERLGIDVHVLSTGIYKGIGVEGAPLSPEALAYLRSRVEGINQHFLAAIQRGRGLNDAQMGLVSDGRVHLAATAQQLGLIDAVQSFDETLYQLRNAGTTPQRLRAMQAEVVTLPAHPTAGHGPHDHLTREAAYRPSAALLRHKARAQLARNRSVPHHG